MAYEVAHTLDQANGQAVCATGDVFHALRAEGFDASEDGTGRGSGAVVAFDSRQDPVSSRKVFGSLGSSLPQAQALAFEPGVMSHCGGHIYNECSGTLRKEPGDNLMSLVSGAQVRRLTPTECERLQGFPDNYTAIPWRKKPADECPDGPRYKALGNSMAVSVIRWIGKSIEAALKGRKK